MLKNTDLKFIMKLQIVKTFKICKVGLWKKLQYKQNSEFETLTPKTIIVPFSRYVWWICFFKLLQTRWCWDKQTWNYCTRDISFLQIWKYYFPFFVSPEETHIYSIQIGSREIRQNYFCSQQSENCVVTSYYNVFLMKLWAKRTNIKTEKLFGLSI